MAKIQHKSYNQNDSLLFPPCLGDFIADNDPVRVLDAIVANLDITPIEATYKAGGCNSYHPRMLLKVILYAYLQNIYSGRKMEQLLKRDVHFMWLSGMQRPDFNTINLFRKHRLAGFIDNIFTQVVEMLVNAKFVSLEVQYVDGTKIEANANKYTFVWKKSTKTYQEKLDLKVKDILREAERVLDMELQADNKGVITAEELQKRTDAIICEMDKRGISNKPLRKTVKQIRDKSVAKMREYEDKLNTIGDRGSYSKTDKDATFMRMKEDAMNNGQLKPGYNVQISTENQFITNYGIYQRPADTGTLIDYIESFEKRYGKKSKDIVADAGYGSEQNYEYLFANEMMPYVKYNYFHKEQKSKFKDNPYLQQNLLYDKDRDVFVCPNNKELIHTETNSRTTELGYESKVDRYECKDCSNCPLKSECIKTKGNRKMEVNHTLNEYKQQVRELLTSEQGLYHRSKRSVEPEAVFGQIKHNHHFRRFNYRGKAMVQAEFATIATVHNIRKYITKSSIQTANRLPA